MAKLLSPVIVSCNICITKASITLLLTGPFWICTTLVFTTAIAGNMASYLSVEGKDFTWKYDFHKGILKSTCNTCSNPLCLVTCCMWSTEKFQSFKKMIFFSKEERKYVISWVAKPCASASLSLKLSDLECHIVYTCYLWGSAVLCVRFANVC